MGNSPNISRELDGGLNEELKSPFKKSTVTTLPLMTFRNYGSRWGNKIEKKSLWLLIGGCYNDPDVNKNFAGRRGTRGDRNAYLEGVQKDLDNIAEKLGDGRVGDDKKILWKKLNGDGHQKKTNVSKYIYNLCRAALEKGKDWHPVIYYSGHGRGLATWDLYTRKTYGGDWLFCENQPFTMGELKETVKAAEYDPRKVVIISDACYSGWWAERGAENEYYVYSSASDENAMDSADGGFFTRILLEDTLDVDWTFKKDSFWVGTESQTPRASIQLNK